MFIVEEEAYAILYRMEYIIKSSNTVRGRFGGIMLCTTALF
jgi:hypothetical protein